ncbi:CSC1-like protein ERD4 [Hondaea fermentalgiana]|uniref:CSC1-like protein ERD4 n=1 Tax=Hondaea fermentalgiana TaxID=2315210 RepID=A0A2R5GTI2_9STRA|nr:CSC1-like protein ERD4 [Hondaea fermentalgiana]|eukprot:GBG34172.1 CSC1-like protein ERD4 [Hondaea fermentalgiana]
MSSEGSPTVPPTVEAPVTTSELRTTVALYGSIGLACVIVHALLRTYLRSLYSPRKKHIKWPQRPIEEVPKKPWMWFLPLLRPKTDRDIYERVGMDAYVTIRFIVLGLKLFGIIMPIGLIILGSSYAATGSSDNLSSGDGSGNAYKMTLQYVSGGAGVGTKMLWLPCVFVYIFSAIGLYLLHHEYANIVEKQRSYMLCMHPSTYSVMIERIPRDIHSKKALTRYFESLFPGSDPIVSIIPVKSKKTDELMDLVDERNEVVTNLERAMLLEYYASSPERKSKILDGNDAGGPYGDSTVEKGGRGKSSGAKKRRKRSATDDESNHLASVEEGVAATDNNGNASGEGQGGSINDDDADDDNTWRAEHIAFSKGKTWMNSRALCHGWLCYVFGQGEKVLSVEHYERRLTELNDEIAKKRKEVNMELVKGRDLEYPYKEGDAAKDSAEDDSEAMGTGSAASLEHDNANDNSAGDEWLYDSKTKKAEAVWLLNDGKHVEDADSKYLSQSAAFVTFNSKLVSTAVGRCMNSERNAMVVNPAPQEEDVNWERLGCHPKMIVAGRILVLAINIFCLLVFGFITGSISATVNLTTLRSKLPNLDDFLADNPWAEPVIDQVAPLLLVILFALVPPILHLILRLRCDLSESARDNSFFMNYSVFLVFQLFLFFQISNAIFTVLADSFDNPREFVNLLAQMIPSNATFFMQFITIRMFWILPGSELLRVGPMAVAFIVRPIFCGLAKTPREKRDDCCGCRTFGTPGDAGHASLCANVYLVMCIGVTYSVIAPLVTVFALVYFMVALIVYRNQLCYVYVKEKESCGSMWPYLAMAYLFAFALMQLTMLGIFALSEGVAQSVLMIIPLFLTSAYIFFFYTLYDTSTAFIRLNTAREYDIDPNDETGAHDAERNPFLKDFGQGVSLRTLWERHWDAKFRHPAQRGAMCDVEATSVKDMLGELEEMKSNKEPSPGGDSTSTDTESTPGAATGNLLDEDSSRSIGVEGTNGSAIEQTDSERDNLMTMT